MADPFFMEMVLTGPQRGPIASDGARLGILQDYANAGGARGEVSRGISGELRNARGRASSRFTSAVSTMLGDGATTAAPTTEHTGQTCAPEGASVKSAQKCSCPRQQAGSSHTSWHEQVGEEG